MLRETVLNGSDVESAELTESDSNQKELAVLLSSQGSQKFAEATAKNVGRQLAIVWNGRAITAPVIQSPITGRRVSINGLFSQAEAQQLLNLLNHRSPSATSPP